MWGAVLLGSGFCVAFGCAGSVAGDAGRPCVSSLQSADRVVRDRSDNCVVAVVDDEHGFGAPTVAYGSGY